MGQFFRNNLFQQYQKLKCYQAFLFLNSIIILSYQSGERGLLESLTFSEIQQTRFFVTVAWMICQSNKEI